MVKYKISLAGGTTPRLRFGHGRGWQPVVQCVVSPVLAQGWVDVYMSHELVKDSEEPNPGCEPPVQHHKRRALVTKNASVSLQKTAWNLRPFFWENNARLMPVILLCSKIITIVLILMRGSWTVIGSYLCATRGAPLQVLKKWPESDVIRTNVDSGCKRLVVPSKNNH